MKQSPQQWIDNVYPLVDLQLTRAACITWLHAHDLPVPPKSACVMCPFHDRRTWQDMKRRAGTDWETAVAFDTAIRDARNDANATVPIRLYVHRDRKPLAAAVVIPEDFGASQESVFDFDPDNEPTCDSGHCFV